MSRPTVRVVTGGHPFVADEFFAVFDSFPFEWSALTSPPAPELDSCACVVFYDMPGLHFTKADPPVEFVEPTDEQRDVYRRLAAAGTGMVFLHHAVASWPTWAGFADLIGGRFHYQPAELRGEHFPDSGYVFDVEHTVEILAPDHPVCAGLGESFTITDELYCSPVFESDVVPLMRTTFDVADSANFFSADLAIRGRRRSNDGWSHPAGSSLVAWTKQVDRSRLVYLQFGDGPVTYQDPNYRTALRNAIRWAARAG